MTPKILLVSLCLSLILLIGIDGRKGEPVEEVGSEYPERRSRTSACLVLLTTWRSDSGLGIVDSGWSRGNSLYADHPPQSVAPKERGDFDDGANALWSHYGKKAQTHDETIFQGLSENMDGVPTFVRVSTLVRRRLDFNHPVSTGRLVCCRSHFLPHRQPSEFATRSCATSSILSPAIGRDARPNLTANRVYRP
jgi:hypothetical protein